VLELPHALLDITILDYDYKTRRGNSRQKLKQDDHKRACSGTSERLSVVPQAQVTVKFSRHTAKLFTSLKIPLNTNNDYSSYIAHLSQSTKASLLPLRLSTIVKQRFNMCIIVLQRAPVQWLHKGDNNCTRAVAYLASRAAWWSSSTATTALSTSSFSTLSCCTPAFCLRTSTTCSSTSRGMCMDCTR
jgi:hypothetical protein